MNTGIRRGFKSKADSYETKNQKTELGCTLFFMSQIRISSVVFSYLVVFYVSMPVFRLSWGETLEGGVTAIFQFVGHSSTSNTTVQ